MILKYSFGPVYLAGLSGKEALDRFKPESHLNVYFNSVFNFFFYYFRLKLVLFTDLVICTIRPKHETVEYKFCCYFESIGWVNMKMEKKEE